MYVYTYMCICVSLSVSIYVARIAVAYYMCMMYLMPLVVSIPPPTFIHIFPVCLYLIYIYIVCVWLCVFSVSFYVLFSSLLPYFPSFLFPQIFPKLSWSTYWDSRAWDRYSATMLMCRWAFSSDSGIQLPKIMDDFIVYLSHP